MWLDDTAPAVDVKVYVLKSLVSEERCKRYIETSTTAAPMGFAVAVVGILQLAGERVPEGNAALICDVLSDRSNFFGSFTQYSSPASL